MKTNNANRIITFIWVIIALSALKSIITLISSGVNYSQQPFVFWLSTLNLATTLILLMMSFYMRKIIQSYTLNNSWQPANYSKMKTMGYLAILLVGIHTCFQIGYDCVWVQLSKNPVPISGLYIFRRFYAIILTESPAIWVLALSIFLFAELLKSAHQVKAENESFI
jgi:hypothetical protein